MKQIQYQEQKIIESIEEDGKLLLKTYEKKKELSNKLNFDPAKKVQDLIEKMKRTIKRNINKGGSNDSDDEQDDEDNDDDNQNSDSDNDSDNGENLDDDSSSRKRRKGNKGQSQNFFQNNQQLMIILGLATLVIFYLMNQKEKISRTNEQLYDF